MTPDEERFLDDAVHFARMATVEHQIALELESQLRFYVERCKGLEKRLMNLLIATERIHG